MPAPVYRRLCADVVRDSGVWLRWLFSQRSCRASRGLQHTWTTVMWCTGHTGTVDLPGLPCGCLAGLRQGIGDRSCVRQPLLLPFTALRRSTGNPGRPGKLLRVQTAHM
jgi:hypothetical protein